MDCPPVSPGGERGPRGSPGTGRGGGAHREPVVKVGTAPGARPGRGEAGLRGSGVGNLISGSSAFSKTSLNIWKFTVHVLLKPEAEALINGISAFIKETSLGLPTFFGHVKTQE